MPDILVPPASLRSCGMALSATGFDEACAALDAALAGRTRAAILDEVSKAKSFDRAARRLREAMRGHRFDTSAGADALDLRRLVKRLDDLGRADGFHLLNDWDGKADRFNDDTIPVEVATFVERVLLPRDDADARMALAVLLDYYFLHLVALLAMRVWDAGDVDVDVDVDANVDANVDAINRLLDRLQGEEGSGQVFVRHAVTAMVIATSHFEPDIRAYDAMLMRTRRLAPRHRLALARMHAGVMGCHLRFGLEVTCAGRIPALRDDNVPDYPWLGDAIATLLDASAAETDAAARRPLTEALFIALMPDPLAFIGAAPPPSLDGHRDVRTRIAELWRATRDARLDDFEALRPALDRYSPLHFTFNFPHNLVKGAVVDAALRGAPWKVALEDLVSGPEIGASTEEERRSLATKLTRYALASPDTINGRPHPAIVYHPEAGLRAFERALEGLR